MKKIAIITVSIVLVSIMGLTAVGAAHWRSMKSAEGRIDYIKEKITDTLDLSETQTATLDRIAEDILVRHDQMETRRDDFKVRFFDVLDQDEVSAEELTQLFEEKKPHIDRLMQLMAQHIAEFHAVLTPEQRAKLIDEMKNHRHGCRFGQ